VGSGVVLGVVHTRQMAGANRLIDRLVKQRRRNAKEKVKEE
jgi:hypothetical protein